MNECSNDALPCSNCTTRGRTEPANFSIWPQCAGFPEFPDRSLPVRALLQGISEKQRMFQTYHAAPDDDEAAQGLGRDEEAIRVKRGVYCGYVKLHGKEHKDTLLTATNLASSLVEHLKLFEEAKSLCRAEQPCEHV